uniref:Uncharacterized protein n=1 Tax=viral metagenome TaxID=1070528 RepID=A0A6M3XUT4_9ZZZZ
MRDEWLDGILDEALRGEPVVEPEGVRGVQGELAVGGHVPESRSEFKIGSQIPLLMVLLAGYTLRFQAVRGIRSKRMCEVSARAEYRGDGVWVAEVRGV